MRVLQRSGLSCLIRQVWPICYPLHCNIDRKKHELPTSQQPTPHVQHLVRADKHHNLLQSRLSLTSTFNRVVHVPLALECRTLLEAAHSSRKCPSPSCSMEVSSPLLPFIDAKLTETKTTSHKTRLQSQAGPGLAYLWAMPCSSSRSFGSLA